MLPVALCDHLRLSSGFEYKHPSIPICSAAQIDSEEFFAVLSKIHRHSKFLQNKPPQFVPKEDLVAMEVLEVLAPFTVENGGPLIVKKISYAPDRSNVIIHYPGTSSEIVSFVGSHMDTVCLLNSPRSARSRG